MNEREDMDISQKIVRLRKRNSVSQEKLAARLGVSRDTLNNWERGISEPDTAQRRKLAALFHMSPSYFESRPSGLSKLVKILDAITKKHRLAVVAASAVFLCIAFVFLLLAVKFTSFILGFMALFTVCISCLAFTFYSRNKK